MFLALHSWCFRSLCEQRIQKGHSYQETNLYSAFSTILLVIYALFWLSSQLIPKIESLILAPICSTFIISGFIPFCQQSRVVPQADYSQLIELQSRLSDVIELTLAGDAGLAFSVRKSEVALRDLTIQVRVSDLASKDALVGRLENFVAEANDATRGLSRLAARVGGSLDT